MPGRHTAKQKRQAKHIAESERARGVDPKRAESIGWATVNKQMEKAASGKSKRASTLKKDADVAGGGAGFAGEAYSAMGKGRQFTSAEAAFREQTEKLKRRAGQVRKRPFGRRGTVAFGKAAEAALPRPKTQWATPRENMSRMSYGARTTRPSKKPGTAAPHQQNFLQRRKQGIKDLGTVTLTATTDKSMSKTLQVMSISDYYSSMMKAEGGAPPSGGAPSPGGAAAPGGAPAPVKKFPRKMKPTVKMKPISDQEAIANLKAGKYHEKSLVTLAAIKALVSGYGKVAGGGALRAPNRGFTTVGDLQRAMEVMPKPEGSKPPSTYLPGVHDPKSPLRQKKNKKPLLAKKGCDNSFEEPTLKKKSKTSKSYAQAMFEAERDFADQLGESMVDDGPQSVVHKAEGDASMSKTNFNDLFKSELGVAANDDHLVDCPHCEAPITKSDLAKAHKGKGAATNVSGPKTAGGSLRSQNPDGGTMRGGEGRGVHTPSRGVPGAKKTDEPVGVQNSKGSKAHKAMNNSSSCADDVSSGDAPSSRSVKKSLGPTVRGTDFVQYVDYGDAPGSDAYIAKSIAEAQGALGQQATQPMDLNNDLSRLLV